MSLPVISVVIPTVDGRESYFEQCWRAYARHAEQDGYELDLVTERNHPTCGMAWHYGLSRVSLRAQYIHLTCDDIVPRPEWHHQAVEAADQGFLPAPQVYDPNGVPQSHPQPGVAGQDWTAVHMSALPFASVRQMEKIVPLFTAHYFTDDFFSWRGQRAGYPCRLRTGYAFTHYWAQHKRGAGMTENERMAYDHGLFRMAQQMVEEGKWNGPWPAGGNL